MLSELGIDKDMVFAAQDRLIQVWDAEVYAHVAMEPGELSRVDGEIFKD